MAERVLTARRAGPPAVAAALEEALGAALGLEPVAATGVRAARAIAAEVERCGAAFPPGAEPPYHGRHHQAEATLVMGWLCRRAREAGLIDGETALLGIAGMAAHDLHHPGRPNAWPLEHETRAADAAAGIAAGAGATGAWCAALRAVVLATAVPQARDAREGPLLHRLAREADVYGSALPRLGWALSRAIAEELRRAGHPGAAVLATHAGRLGFLRTIPPPTAPGESLGLGVALRRQFDAYALCAARLGPGTTAEQGAAALDALGPEQGEALWEAALAEAGARA